MAESPSTPQPKDAVPAPRREWTSPSLLTHGHIGKLTQGASGNKTETSLNKW